MHTATESSAVEVAVEVALEVARATLAEEKQAALRLGATAARLGATATRAVN